MSRRGFFAAGAAGATALVAGCRGGDTPSKTALPVAPSGGGTPVLEAPGYTDPNKWAGQTLKVAAFGSEIQTALRDAVWRPFSTATGCAILETQTDYNSFATPTANGRAYADVILVDPIWLANPANHELLDSVGDLSHVPFAPIAFTELSAPAYFYAMVNSFRRDAVSDLDDMQSWADWWNVERFDGARSLPNSALGTLEIALLADGVQKADLYPLDIDRALGSLQAISGKIGDRWWTSGEQPADWLDRGRATLAAAWHHRMLAAQYDGRPVDFVWDEGLYVADFWVVPKLAAAPDVARDLIAYSSARETQARLAQTVPLGPSNPDAFELIPTKIVSRLPTTPENLDQLIPIDATWWSENGEAARTQLDEWRANVPTVTPS